MTSPFHDKGDDAAKIAAYLEMLIARTGLDLKFNLLLQDGCAECDRRERDAAAEETPALPQAAAGLAPATLVPSAPALAPWLRVEFTGPDTPLLLAGSAELLHALEHLAAKILRLEPEDHDRISFDADGFKAARHAELERAAELAVESVRATNRPHAFAPMNSRERRILHLMLTRSGLPTASSSLGPRRFVVLYPQGSPLPAPAQSPDSADTQNTAADRTAAIRSRFRRR